MHVLITALLMCSAVASAAAQSAVTIDPGMNLDQVIQLALPAGDTAAKDSTKPAEKAEKKDSTKKAPAKPPAGHEG